MTLLTLALVVGVLFGTGTYLILQRRAIRLILGLALLTHGVILLLFSSGGLSRGLPPIILDKKAFDGDITPFVDPLPQALILTAIVISFAVTAFTVVLVNRRHALTLTVDSDATGAPSMKASDPFASMEHYVSGLDQEPDDYEWLEFSLADELRRRRAKVENEEAEAEEVAEKSKVAPPMAIDSSGDSDESRYSLDDQDGDLFTSEAFTSEADAEEIPKSETGQSDAGQSDAGETAADQDNADQDEGQQA